MSERDVDPALAALRDLPWKYIGGWRAGCYDSYCDAGRHSQYCRDMSRWAVKHGTVLRVAQALRDEVTA